MSSDGLGLLIYNILIVKKKLTVKNSKFKYFSLKNFANVFSKIIRLAETRNRYRVRVIPTVCLLQHHDDDRMTCASVDIAISHPKKVDVALCNNHCTVFLVASACSMHHKEGSTNHDITLVTFTEISEVNA